MSHVDFWVCLNYFLQRCSHIFVWQSYDWVKSRNKSLWVKFPQSVSTESSISILQFQLKIFESVSAICLVENSGILSQIGGLLQVTWDLGLLGLILDPIVDYSLELNSSASTHWVDDDMVGFEWNMLYYWKWPRVCVDKTFPKCFVAQGLVLQIKWNLPWNWSQSANCSTYLFWCSISASSDEVSPISDDQYASPDDDQYDSDHIWWRSSGWQGCRVSASSDDDQPHLLNSDSVRSHLPHIW